MLSGAAHGLAESGLLPSRPLTEALTRRLTVTTPRGVPAVQEADARTVSMLMHATAKFVALQGKAAAAGTVGPGTAGVTAGPGAGVGVTEGVWAPLRQAAEVKLRRALGEEPTPQGQQGPGQQGAAAEAVEEEEGPEVDDSMPQVRGWDGVGGRATFGGGEQSMSNAGRR